MELKYVEADEYTSLTVNGIELWNMTPEEIKVSIQAMLDRESDTSVLLDIWTTLIESQGNIKGNWIYTLKI